MLGPALNPHAVHMHTCPAASCAVWLALGGYENTLDTYLQATLRAWAVQKRHTASPSQMRRRKTWTGSKGQSCQKKPSSTLTAAGQSMPFQTERPGCHQQEAKMAGQACRSVSMAVLCMRVIVPAENMQFGRAWHKHAFMFRHGMDNHLHHQQLMLCCGSNFAFDGKHTATVACRMLSSVMRGVLQLSRDGSPSAACVACRWSEILPRT